MEDQHTVCSFQEGNDELLHVPHRVHSDAMFLMEWGHLITKKLSANEMTTGYVYP